jgi:hypothetical protein
MAPTGVELFLLGAAGALVSFAVAFALPELIRQLDDSAKFTWRKGFVFLLIMATFLLVGGLVTVGFGAADNKAAFFTGLGWQGLVKGIIESASRLQQASPAR